jgi:hypothetical protein
VDLETFIVATYGVVDEALVSVLGEHRLRQRGSMPILADSEVLTMEVVGEFFRLDQDTTLFTHFRRYHTNLFPALTTIHRPTFAREAANLWRVKACIWQQVLTRIPHDRDPAHACTGLSPAPACPPAHLRNLHTG